MRPLIVLLCLAAYACSDSPTTASQTMFTGHWIGSYVVRQCVPVGWPSCDVAPERLNQTYPFDLVVTQSGSTVSGTAHIVDSPVMDVPVTGSASSDSMMLSGNITNPVLNKLSTDSIRITRWATTRDSRGNLQGTFSFHWQVLWGPASVPPQQGTWSLDYDVELVNVVRQQ